MCRVKEGRVTKPSGSPGGGALPRRRGRPAIDWTQSRKRRLLRLYLCTPEAELSLRKILELLAEGPFQPKPRHTQCLLNDMLSKSYRQKRPKNRAAMAERVAYLRSVRDGKVQTTVAAPRREIVKECAILLTPNPRSRNNMIKPSSQPNARSVSGEPNDGEPLSSLLSAAADSTARPDTASSVPSRGSLDTSSGVVEPRTSLESEAPGDVGTEGLPPSPELFRHPWGGSSSSHDETRHEQIEFLRERCPSRASSFLADVASLLSGLSIRSGLSRSSSGSSRRSGRSGFGGDRGRVGEVEEGCSGMERGEWECLERPSTGESVSAAWSGDLHTHTPVTAAVTVAGGGIPASPNWQERNPKREAWVYTPNSSTPDNTNNNNNNTSHTLENQELVRSCCSKTAWCIHQRITAVLMHGSPAETFTCAAAEVNSRDGLGNTALHVAARWGAPWQVLFRIMALADDLNAANHRGETFLYVLDPSSLAPRGVAHIIRYLASKGFDFTQLDETGQNFVSRLLASPSFGLEALEEVFSHVPERERLALVRQDPHHLMGCIRARLLADPASTAESVAEYCAYFTARYCTRSASSC